MMILLAMEGLLRPIKDTFFAKEDQEAKKRNLQLKINGNCDILILTLFSIKMFRI